MTTKAHMALQAEIHQLTQEFLAKGNSIKQVPSHVMKLTGNTKRKKVQIVYSDKSSQRGA